MALKRQVEMNRELERKSNNPCSCFSQLLGYWKNNPKVLVIGLTMGMQCRAGVNHKKRVFTSNRFVLIQVWLKTPQEIYTY